MRGKFSESTVKVHIGNIFRQIGVRDRNSAALWAREHLPPPDLTGNSRYLARRAPEPSPPGPST